MALVWNHISRRAALKWYWPGNPRASTSRPADRRTETPCDREEEHGHPGDHEKRGQEEGLDLIDTGAEEKAVEGIEPYQHSDGEDYKWHGPKFPP